MGPNAVTQVLKPVQTVPISNDMSNVILPPWAPSLEFIVRNCACHYCNKTPNQSIILRSCKYILFYRLISIVRAVIMFQNWRQKYAKS
jgi:hypothetical protein